jgi:prephenate dehydratase
MVAPCRGEKASGEAVTKRVGYQGSEGCYAEQAAMRYFAGKEQVTLVPYKSLDDVCLRGFC